jgi:hypothetical protein
VFPSTAFGEITYDKEAFTRGMTYLDDPTTLFYGGDDEYDDEYVDVDIGFTFEYYGKPYTTVRVSTNGYMTFYDPAESPGSSDGTDYSNDAIPDTNDPDNFLAPWWDDLEVRDEGVTDKVSYKTTGSPPNRVFTVEWKSVSYYDDDSSSYMHFQVKLYETTNIIEFHYGIHYFDDYYSPSATVGIENADGSDGVGGPSSDGKTSSWPEYNYRFIPVQVITPLESDRSVDVDLTAERDFSFEVESYDWAVVGIRNIDGRDHDIKVDDESSFSWPYTSSTYSGAEPDFVVVNGHKNYGTYYARVYYNVGSGMYSRIEAETSTTTDLSVGSAVSHAMSSDEVNEMYEVDLWKNVDYVVVLDVESGDADLDLYLFDDDIEIAGRGGYTARSDNDRGGAGEVISYRPPDTGIVGIVVVHDGTASDSASYEIKVSEDTYPYISVDAPPGAESYNDGTYDWYNADDLGSITVNVYAEIAPDAKELRGIYWRLVDSAGNPVPNTQDVHVDTVYPESSYDIFTTSDNAGWLSGQGETSKTYEGFMLSTHFTPEELDSLSEGSVYTLEWRVDENNIPGEIGGKNYQSKDVYSFKIDRTPPTSLITSPAADSWQKEDFLVSVSDVDGGGSGLRKCYYAVYDTGYGWTVDRWTERTCDGMLVVSVGPSGDCRTEGSDTCRVYTYDVDNVGNSEPSHYVAYSIAYTPPDPAVWLEGVPEKVDPGGEFWVTLWMRNDGGIGFNTSGVHIHVENGEIVGYDTGDFHTEDVGVDPVYELPYAEFMLIGPATEATSPPGDVRHARVKIRAGEGGEVRLSYRSWMRDFEEYIYRTPDDPDEPDGTETYSTKYFMDYAAYLEEVPVFVLEPPEVVASITVDKYHPRVQEFFTLTATARNLGGKASGTLKLYCDGTLLDAKNITLDKYETDEILFSINQDEPGPYACTAEATLSNEVGGSMDEDSLTVMVEPVMDLHVYPDLDYAYIYGDMVTEVKLNVSSLIGPRDVLVYPFVNGEKVYYNEKFMVNGTTLQIIWGGHDPEGFKLEENRFTGSDALAFFHVIHWGGTAESVDIKFKVEDASIPGKIYGEKDIAFRVKHVPPDQTARYFERYHPEDHYPLGAEPVTPPTLTVSKADDELRIYLDGNEIGKIAGDVDDLDGDILGPYTYEELRNIFYYHDPETGDEYWIARLWFIWLKDGPDKPPDQYPDGECFELWIPRGTYDVKWIETFVHSSAWWFIPEADKATTIGDVEHTFLDKEGKEAHTPSPNEHYSPFYGLVAFEDPTNEYIEVTHVTASADWFGSLERLESSINVHLSVIPAVVSGKPTNLSVIPESEGVFLVEVVNDGAVHDKIRNKTGATFGEVTRFFLNGSTITYPLEIKSTPPMLGTDVPAGRGVSTYYDWTMPPVDAYDHVDVYAEVEGLLDWDFAILFPKTLEKAISTETYAGQISQGQTVTQNFTVEEETASLTFTLGWTGTDLDLHIYDPLGRHAGVDYRTGAIESQIPNVSYSGSDARPEWMRVLNPVPGVWEAEVYGKDVPRALEPFALSLVKVKAVGVKAEAVEEVNATYNASGGLISSTARGRIVLENKENFTAEGIEVILGNISATNIDNGTIYVDRLPPGRTTVVEYEVVYRNPRLIVSEDWNITTFEEYVDEALAGGKISQGVAEEAKKDIRRPLFGENNTLIFTISLNNTAPEVLENVTLLHPLPEGIGEVEVISPEGVVYDLERDAITVGKIPEYSSISVVVKGVLPEEALPDPGADYVNLAKNTTATYSVGATLSGVKIEDVRGTWIYRVVLQDISHRTDAAITLTDATLENVALTKPVRVDAKAVEKVVGIYNATQLVSSNATGKVVIFNRDPYPARYDFDVTLENVNLTTLPSATLYAEELRSGENVVAEYFVLKRPRLEMGLEWNTSFDKKLRYGWNETITFKATLNNTSPDELKNVSVTIPLPANLSECCELLGAEPLTDGLSYDAGEKRFAWSGVLNPGEELGLVFRLTLAPVKPETAKLRFNAFASYTVEKTLSGIEIKDVVGNDFYLVTVESKEHKTASELELSQMIEVEIVGKAVLSWVTDEPNELFVDDLTELRSDILFKKVYTKSEFFSELRKQFYSVIFFANTDWNEELTEEEIREIKDTIHRGGPFGRGLILSGFALKYAPELGEVVGDKYIGSLPMGEPFKIKPVTITENHPITTGYVDETLSSTGWAVRVVSTVSKPLAYFEDIMPGKARGKPSYLKELPALTVSTYGKGSGILFAPDIGTSAYENLNRAEWLDLASRTIDWISAVVEAEPEADLKIEKDIYPRVITAKFASMGRGNEEKHAMVKITIRNSGQLDLFDLNVTETLPEGFILANGASSWSMEKLAVGSSANFNYSVWVPAVNASSYELTTTVTALDSRGNEHIFSESITLEVSLPPGMEKNSSNKTYGKGSNSSGNISYLKVNKHLKSTKVNNESRDKSKVKVTIDLLAPGNLPVKAVFVKEYIPEELTVKTFDGIFTGFGLMWVVGTVEHKETLTYTLGLPEVSEPTTYELKTVVEYQTLEDLEILEKTSYLTVSPKAQIKLDEGNESKSVKARGKGYSKVHWGRPSYKGGKGASHGKKKGHDKDKGKPDKPGKPENPGKPDKPPKDPGPPDNPGNPPENPGNGGGNDGDNVNGDGNGGDNGNGEGSDGNNGGGNGGDSSGGGF